MKLSTLILVATLAASPLAYAQAPDAGQDSPPAGLSGPGGSGGPGGPRISPEQRAARRAATQAVMQACKADMQSLCGDQGVGGGKVMMCMRQNRDKVSQGCKDAMAKMRGGRGGRGFGRGPGAPPPAAPN